MSTLEESHGDRLDKGERTTRKSVRAVPVAIVDAVEDSEEWSSFSEFARQAFENELEAHDE